MTVQRQDKVFDYDGYAKSLEVVHEGLSRDYWASILDINRHQVGVGRTYLWVSAALLGGYSAVLEQYQSLIITEAYLVVLFGISYVVAALAFGICLYAIPARKGYRSIPEKGWGEFSAKAYKHLKDGSDQVYAAFLTDHISTVDHAYAHNARTNKDRAGLLRLTSWLLIVSFSVALFSVSVLTTQTLLNHSPKEIIMSEEENTSSQQSSEPTLSVPEPPPPADIGGSDISTHSAEPASGNTFITENAPESKE